MVTITDRDPAAEQLDQLAETWQGLLADFVRLDPAAPGASSTVDASEWFNIHIREMKVQMTAAVALFNSLPGHIRNLPEYRERQARLAGILQAFAERALCYAGHSQRCAGLVLPQPNRALAARRLKQAAEMTAP